MNNFADLRATKDLAAEGKIRQYYTLFKPKQQQTGSEINEIFICQNRIK